MAQANKQEKKKDRTVLLAIGLVGCLGCMAPGVLFAAGGAFFFLLRSDARPVTADSGWTSYKAYESNDTDERDEPAVAILGSKTTSDSYDEEYGEPAEVATAVPAATPIVVETPMPEPTATPVAVRTPAPVAKKTPVPVKTSAPVVRATSTPVARATSTPAPVARMTPAPRATATPLPWEEEEAVAAATPVPTAAPVRVAAVDPNKRVIRTQTGAASVTVGKNLAIKASDGKTAVGQLVDVKDGNVDVRISGKLMRIHESQILEAAEF